MVVVPERFAAERIRKSGAAGRRWVSELPALVERLAGRWQVSVAAEPPLYGDLALVVFGTVGGEPCVLKVSWSDHSTFDEVTALRAWDGHGAVRLLEASPEDGAVLLERLDSSRSLEKLPLLSAAELAGGVIRRLAVPAPAGLRVPREDVPLGEQQAELGSPVPRRWVDQASELLVSLRASSGRTLVHTDLHYGNILGAEREPWLAIDPRPVAGDPELSVPELMWWRLDLDARPAEIRTLLDTLVAAGSLDPDKALAWTVVRAVSYWLWGLRAGLTIDPVRCERLLEALT